jgi:hypothetical protein
MVLAYDFPLLATFWAMFIFFLWIVWLLLLFRTVMDIFRSDDLGGFAKFAWLLVVVVVPYLGVFVYVIARGDKMGQREMARLDAQDSQARAYIRDAAGTPGSTVADQLATLAALRDRGVLSEEEFAGQKAKLLA